METSENERRKVLYARITRSIKFITVLFCLAGFVANSYIIFQQFIAGKTVTSYDIQKRSELFLPSITICNISGFKEEMDEFADLELPQYINKTLYLDEIIIKIEDSSKSQITVQGYSEQGHINGTGKKMENDKKETWKLLTTYSMYKGRCHTIEYKRKVIDNVKTYTLFKCYILYT